MVYVPPKKVIDWTRPGIRPPDRRPPVGFRPPPPPIKVTNAISTGARQRHNHTINVPNFEGNSGSVGSGTAHNNMQPFVVVSYIIKL
jgi:hypothetical protein